eukprot:804497_1
MSDINSTAGQTATGSREGEFGTSEFGERLDYSKPKYQDLWAFILFYVHVIVIIVVAIYFWTVALPEAVEEGTPSPTLHENEESDDMDTSGIWICLICALFAGALFGMLWLQCIKLFAETIIKILLFVQILCWLIVVIIGVIYNIGLVIIGVIFLLLTCLYTWCIWSRIPFAGACLSIASQIVQTYHGTVWLALITVFINFIWVIIWIFAFWAYTLSNDQPSVLIQFLLSISLYWGVNVWRNVSHTTTCGVAATWYFSSGELFNPSKSAFKRTMTTSFGSICFGSLLVAIIQAVRAMLRSQGKGGGCAACLLACIERIMRYFNKYAFAQVAIYGVSFWQSAKATWDLFMNNGLSALINDDLSGLALTCGAVLGMVVSAIAGFFVAQAFYGELVLSIYLAILCGILGYYVVVIILLAVASGVVAIFVCFAEDPAACKTNRPEAFDKLTGVNETMRNMAGSRGVQS